MADYPGKKEYEARLRAAERSLENRDRETDKYILDRFAQNLPGQRPDADPGSYIPKETDSPGYRYGDRYVDRDMFPRDPSRDEILEGWDQYKKDLEAVSSGGDDEARRRIERQDPDGWYETRRNLQRRSDPHPGSRFNKRLNPNDPLTDKERQQLEQLENEMAEALATPGAEKDRPGRLQELIEAANLFDPDSAGRAALRELKRKMVDDRAPRVRIGRKTQSGEEILEAKMKEMEDDADIQQGFTDPRKAAMQELGWSSVPESVPVFDRSGNRVPVYLDEMKKAREEAAEKAYLRHRRDPTKDTPERD